MKKFLLAAGLWLTALAGMQAQSKTTGSVTLGAASNNMTATLELNSATSTATLTLTGPTSRWFAVQFGSFSDGGGMQSGTDMVYFNGSILVDCHQNGIGVTPSTDGTNNWNTTFTTSGTTVTVVGTRAFNTGDANDYTFVYSNTDIDFAWAKSTSASYTLANHSSNRGYALNKTFTCVAPAAPTASAQTYCNGATVANLTATGGTGAVFKWYTAATGGTALAGTTALATGTYYVSQTIGDCESTRQAVAVSITTVALPTASENQSFCDGSTVANLAATAATGGTLAWYSASIGGTALASTTVLTSATYYVSQSVSGCTSARKAVVVTVAPLAQPTAESTQSFCDGSTVANLAATGQTGATIKWFASATGGTQLASTTVLTSSTYYVSQTLAPCESTRKAVVVTVAPLAQPTASENQSYCDGSTVANLTATGQTGATIKWFASATGGTQLATTTPLTNGTYYVSQTLAPCESTRKAVVVTIAPLAQPVASENQVVCNGSTIADLAATPQTGATLRWYAAATGGTALASTTVLTATTYYVSQVSAPCESPRKAVAVTFTVVALPTVESPQELCANSLVEDLEADPAQNGELHWYASQTGNPLSGTTVLAAGTYYVSQTIEGCESAKTPVTVTLLPAPAAPTGNASQEFEAGAMVNSLTVGIIVGSEVNWYMLDGNDYEEIDATTTALEDGVVYYVSQTVDGCESTKLAITAHQALGTANFGLSALSVFPNPATDAVTISNKSLLSGVGIYNLLGQQVLYKKVNDSTVQLALGSLAGGTYILKVQAANGSSASLRIVKR